MRSDEYIKELKKKHQAMEKCPTCNAIPNLIFEPSGIFNRVHCYKCGTRMYDTDHIGPFVMINKWDKEVLEIKLNTKVVASEDYDVKCLIKAYQDN
jgi:Zn ribbon nucleic-acid-binding protein